MNWHIECLLVTFVPLPPPLLPPSSIAAVASSVVAPSVACTPLGPSSRPPFPPRPFLLRPCPPFVHILLGIAIALHPRRLGPRPSEPGSTIRIASGAVADRSCCPGGSPAAGCCSSVEGGIRLGLDRSCTRSGPRIVDCTVAAIAVVASEIVVLALEPFCDRQFWAFSFGQIL